ncbi:hypothetical protein ANO11243_000510 [Dothideomycetidae sp. 11243]|nr:hypothetical protein ANO11243_000510 [fungal sp. No.11243]
MHSLIVLSSSFKFSEGNADFGNAAQWQQHMTMDKIMSLSRTNPIASNVPHGIFAYIRKTTFAILVVSIVVAITILALALWCLCRYSCTRRKWEKGLRVVDDRDLWRNMGGRETESSVAGTRMQARLRPVDEQAPSRIMGRRDRGGRPASKLVKPLARIQWVVVTAPAELEA